MLLVFPAGRACKHSLPQAGACNLSFLVVTVAETCGGPLSPLGSFGVLTRRVGSPTDPSVAKIHQRDGSGALLDPHKMTKAKQYEFDKDLDLRYEGLDIVDLQLLDSCVILDV